MASETDSEIEPQERSNAESWVAGALGWVLPGLGHFYLGRRVRAAVFLLIIGTAVVIGCSLEGNLYRPMPDQPLSYLATLACMGTGLPYFLLRYGLGYAGHVVAPGYEYGSAFLITAGLMNLLLVLDVLDIARGRKT